MIRIFEEDIFGWVGLNVDEVWMIQTYRGKLIPSGFQKMYWSKYKWRVQAGLYLRIIE